MSKQDDSPAISLFSFQDIITSITGIMFLVVLLLVLLIFESSPNKNPVPQSEKNKKEMQEAAKQIADLKTQIAKLKDFRKQMEKEIAEYQKMPAELIEKKKNELEEEVKILTKTNIELKITLQQLKQQELRELDLIKTPEEEYKETVQSIKIEKEKNKKLKQDIAASCKRLDAIKKTVTFSVEQNSDKKSILAEFSADGFVVLDFSANKVYDLRCAGESDQKKVDSFIDWVKGRDNVSENISVILNPENLRQWDIISLQLKDLGFSHGLELHPDKNSSIFSPTAAGDKK